MKLIEKLLDKKYPKVFRVRVLHYSRDKYVVNISNTRFKPEWSCIDNYLYIDRGCCGNGWNPKMGLPDAMETFAHTFKSMKDVEAYREKEQAFALKCEHEIKPYEVKDIL